MPTRQRVYRTHAVVLRRRDYGDADRILKVLTPDQGKVELIAKGIRKTTSRKAGHLELLTHTALLVAKGRTWDIVTEASTVENFRHVREDLTQISRASYLCELIDAFTEADDENYPLWELLLLALRELNGDIQPMADAQTLICWFELHLLSVTGFQPQFFHCIQCGVDLEPVTNFLSLVDGGVFCPQCGARREGSEPIEGDILKVLRFLQSRAWNTVRQVNIRPHILRRVDNILYRYLLTVLERHLKSADFLRRIQSLAPETQNNT